MTDSLKRHDFGRRIAHAHNGRLKKGNVMEIGSEGLPRNV